MNQVLKNRLKKIFTTISHRDEIKIVVAMIVFLILNTLKITLFNYYLIPVQTADTFQYKFEITLLLAIIFYQLLFKIKSRIMFIAFYVLQTVYILANIGYYFYFHSYLHILQWLTLFGEAYTSAGHSAAPISAKMLIVFIDLPILIYLALNYFKIAKVNLKIKVPRKVLTAISLIAIMVIEGQNYAYGFSLIQYTGSEFRGETPIVQRYGTLVNNAVSICSSSSENDLINQLQYGKDQSSTKEVQDKPNFVVIQVESMDANVINQQYKGEYIAPFLHSLSTQSVYYPYTMSYHKGGGTSDSEFSIINSVEPLGEFPAIKLSNYDYINSMVSKLAEGSYTTMAFHGNVGDFYNRDTAFPKMGFQQFFDMNKMNMGNVGWGAPDSDVFNYAAEQISNVKQPFFSYIITMTSHGPFINARNYYNNTRYDDIKDETVKNYFNSMSYVDQSIKDFVTKIEATNKNTYVFIWGDHTPNINTDIYKQVSMTIGDKYFEFVPLIIKTPDNKVYREDSIVASFLDISPTILNASGIKFDIKSDGINLIDFKKDSGAIPFRGSSFDRRDLFEGISKVKE